MGAVMAMELLFEQIRSAVSAALWEYHLTPPAWQMMSWLQLEREVSGSRLGDLTCRSRQETQRLLTNLEKRGLVERLPDVVTNRTAAWTLTDEGRCAVAEVSGRLSFFDRLLEQEFRDQLGDVMTAVSRIRTVFTTRMISSTGQMFEARLRAAGRLLPPKQWKPDAWDL